MIFDFSLFTKEENGENNHFQEFEKNVLNMRPALALIRN